MFLTRSWDSNTALDSGTA